MQLSYPLFVALRYLRFHRGRTFLSVITLISIAGVAVGTAALVIALSLNAGFVEDVRERIHSGSAHLTVMSFEDERFEGGTELADSVAHSDGVAAAAPVLFTPGMIVAEGLGATGYAEIHGVEPAAHVTVVSGDVPPDSPFLRLEHPAEGRREGIVLGAGLARRLGVAEGDSVRVLVPQITLAPWGPTPRSAVYDVVGTFTSDHFQQDEQRAYIHRRVAGRLLRAATATNWIEVRLNDLRELPAVKQSLRQELGQPWLVLDLIEQNQDIIKALNTERLLLFLAIGLIVVVAALNIVSTLILMVTDKVKEIGTLCAMGARANGIASIFMLQGVLIGTVGTALGLVVGWQAAYWLNELRLLPLNPDVYYLSYVPFYVQISDVASVGIATLVVSFVATLYPAMKAARLNPVEALRYE